MNWSGNVRVKTRNHPWDLISKFLRVMNCRAILIGDLHKLSLLSNHPHHENSKVFFEPKVGLLSSLAICKFPKEHLVLAKSEISHDNMVSYLLADWLKLFLQFLVLFGVELHYHIAPRLLNCRRQNLIPNTPVLILRSIVLLNSNNALHELHNLNFKSKLATVF